jgi:hypothetical protein
MVKLRRPAPLVFALIVTVPEPAPPTLALSPRRPASPAHRPAPLEVGPATAVPSKLVTRSPPALRCRVVRFAPSACDEDPPSPRRRMMLRGSQDVRPTVPDPAAPAAGVIDLPCPSRH